MTPQKQKTSRLLTETELELMSYLWKLGEGTVADVQRELPADRKLAYTSISTILRILEQKGIVGSRKEGRGHVYVPKTSKQAYEATALKDVVKRVFNNEPSTLVKRLLETGDLSAEELRSLSELLKGKA